MIGTRLRLARGGSGLSLRDLADAIGGKVSAQAIGKYERDESMPGSAVLIALAKALGTSVEYLLGDQDLVLESVDFRKKAIASKREESRVQAQVLHLLERYLVVEELLGLPSVEWALPEGAPFPVLQSLAEADTAAMYVRDQWRLGNDPIPNLFELLEEKGIKLLAFPLGEEIDGLTANARRAQREPVPVVVVNSTHWHERQRFTLAHELAHKVLDVKAGLDEEKAAHRFASAFLMPAEPLWSEIGKHRSSVGWAELFRLKEMFGVSVQALTYRCKDLGIFSDALFRKLFQEFIRRGWRKPPYEEPGALAPRRPCRFERLVLRALSEGALSEAKAAEMLEISVRELSRRMDEPPEIHNAMASAS